MIGGWPIRRLDQLADVGAGNPAPQGPENFAGGTVPFFRTSDVGRIHLGELSESEDWVNEIGAKGMRLHPPGTVLMPKSGASTFTDHRVITGRAGYVSSHLATIKADGRNACDRFLYYALQTVSARDVAGDSSYPTLSLAQVRAIEIPAPPLAQQQRIVTRLETAFAGIADAVAAAKSAIAASHDLVSSVRDGLLNGDGQWVERPLRQVLRVKHGFAFESKYFTPDGDYVLLTPGNFYERGGFRDRGAIQKRYRGPTPAGFTLQSGDLLVAMTEQAAGLLGSPLIVPAGEMYLHNQRLGLIEETGETQLDRRFLFHLFNSAAFRQHMQGTATGTKVRHTSPDKIGAFVARIPPTLELQAKLAARIDSIVHEAHALIVTEQRKLSALTELKQSLLVRAFSGELTAAKDNAYATPEHSANVIAYIYWRHERAQRNLSYRRVKAQKALDLVERIGGVELGRAPYKDAAGPNDLAHMNVAQAWAKANAFFEFVRRGEGYDFKPLAKYSERLAAAQAALKPIASQLDRVADILLPKDKEESEVFATVLAAWNNLIADGQDASDASILKEARDNWHADKLQIAVSKFTDAIREIRRLDLVPDGTTKVVRHRQASLL